MLSQVSAALLVIQTVTDNLKIWKTGQLGNNLHNLKSIRWLNETQAIWYTPFILYNETVSQAIRCEHDADVDYVLAKHQMNLLGFPLCFCGIEKT